ncbi:hypothetical protein GCM10028807_15620 [Spirosoma daeguense]
MKKQEPLQLQRISVFMPQRLRDDEIERLFIMRQDVFHTLLDSIKSEKATSIPQHHLIIGQRGMGKTTLLKRLDVELRNSALSKKFIPFTFPEEQYNIDRLSKFWLNSLDALADTLQTEGDEKMAFQLDEQIATLSAIRNEQELSQKAYESLRSITKTLSRRPVFLLDNLNLIFDRLGEVEQSKLRKLITEPGAPIFVGASPEAFDEDLQYDAPFYDAFAVHFLYKLDFRQTLTMLRHLAEITNQTTLLSQLTADNLPRLETLHALTGGNVRTVVILFSLVAQGFSADVFQDLEALIDQMTPLYKSRFEELAPQAQVVVDAVALNWDPCKLETLRERTSLENSQLSAQLDRLAKAGWISKLGRRKAANYEISERFFNVWYLMRRATRRQRRDLLWLTRFLQAWFTRPELVQQAKAFMRNVHEREKVYELAYGLALARALPNQTGEKLKERIYQRLLQLVDGDVAKLEELVGVNMEEVSEEIIQKYNADKSYQIYLDAWLKDDKVSLEETEMLLRQAIELNVNNDSAWGDLGSIYQKKGNLDKAEFAYRKAVEIDPSNIHNRIDLARFISSQKDRINEAENIYFEVINDNLNTKLYWWIWSSYGDFLYDTKGDYHNSVLAYRRSLGLYPKNPSDLTSLADVFHYGLQQYDEAEKYYLEAIKANVRLPFPRVKYAFFLIFRERYTEAESVLYKAISLKKESSLAFFVLGNHLLKMSRYSEAEPMLSKAVKLDDQNALYWRRLGELNHYFLRNYSKAIDAYGRVNELEGIIMENLSNNIYLYRDTLNDRIKAQKEFEIMIEKFSGDNVSFLHRASFAAYDQDWAKAMQDWSILLTRSKDIIIEKEKMDWHRSAAVTVRLGYGEQLQTVFRETGHDRIFRPFYEAIKALTLNSEEYLKTEVAAEVRDVALQIFKFMQDYNAPAPQVQ